MADLESILARIVLDPESQCWCFSGALTNGYGHATIAGKKWRAHRYVYTQLVGPIPAGLDLDHVRARGCRHRHCVNPDHLEPVKRRENLLRGDTFNAQNILKTHCPAGHPYAGRNLYVDPNRGDRLCRACYAKRARERWARQRAERFTNHL